VAHPTIRVSFSRRASTVVSAPPPPRNTRSTLPFPTETLVASRTVRSVAFSRAPLLSSATYRRSACSVPTLSPLTTTVTVAGESCAFGSSSGATLTVPAVRDSSSYRSVTVPSVDVTFSVTLAFAGSEMFANRATSRPCSETTSSTVAFAAVATPTLSVAGGAVVTAGETPTPSGPSAAATAAAGAATASKTTVAANSRPAVLCVFLTSRHLAFASTYSSRLRSNVSSFRCGIVDPLPSWRAASRFCLCAS